MHADARGSVRWDLSDEIYATAARECANQYHTVRVTRVAVNGDVQGDTAADSKSEIRAFSTCYWDAIETRVKKRQEKGQPLPEQFNMHRTSISIDRVPRAQSCRAGTLIHGSEHVAVCG